MAERVEMIMPLSTLRQRRGEERRDLIWDDNDNNSYSSVVVCPNDSLRGSIRWTVHFFKRRRLRQTPMNWRCSGYQCGYWWRRSSHKLVCRSRLLNCIESTVWYGDKEYVGRGCWRRSSMNTMTVWMYGGLLGVTVRSNIVVQPFTMGGGAVVEVKMMVLTTLLLWVFC